MEMLPPRTLRQMAADEFTRRQAAARAKVAGRGMLVAQAEAHLRPWLAIACLCGADLPGLAGPLADYGASELLITPAEARVIAASAICPRATWVPILAAARNAALDRSAARDSRPEMLQSAQALSHICTALHWDANGHHVPPYRPLAAAQAKNTERLAA